MDTRWDSTGSTLGRPFQSSKVSCAVIAVMPALHPSPLKCLGSLGIMLIPAKLKRVARPVGRLGTRLMLSALQYKCLLFIRIYKQTHVRVHTYTH